MDKQFNGGPFQCSLSLQDGPLHCRQSSPVLSGVSLRVQRLIPRQGPRRFQIEFETGAIWQGRNEIHIPDSAVGTRFSLADVQDSTPIAQRRVEATWYPGSPACAPLCLSAAWLLRGRVVCHTGVVRRRHLCARCRPRGIGLQVRLLPSDLSLSLLRIINVAVECRRYGLHSRCQSGVEASPARQPLIVTSALCRC